jgi:hypothetical protein
MIIMKKMFPFCFCLITLFSCNKETNDKETTTDKKKDEAPCEVVNSVPTSLEAEYGCINTKYQMNIALNNTFQVIKTQSQFNSLVTGTCMPNIDFTRYDLIIGKKGLLNGNKNISYALVRDCPNNKMTLNVSIQNDLTATAPNITYHALVPKLNPTEQVMVNVTVQ